MILRVGKYDCQEVREIAKISTQKNLYLKSGKFKPNSIQIYNQTEIMNNPIITETRMIGQQKIGKV